MDVIIYRAKVKDGWLYDMSFNPGVDCEVLRDTRKTDSIEVLTPYIPLEKGEEILGRIYGKSLLKKFLKSNDYHIKKGMRGIKNSGIPFSESFQIGGVEMPSAEDTATVENCISGKVLTLRRLLEIGPEIRMKQQQIINIVQVLYCERRIRIVPATRKERGRTVCSFCEKPACNGCCLDFRHDDVLLYAADNYNIGMPRSVEFRKKKMNESLTRAMDDVRHFMDNGKKHHATLWCVPGSFDFAILAEAAAKVVSEGGKILYITSRLSIGEAEQELANLMDDASLSVVDRDTLEYKDSDITLCSYNDYPCFHKAFDLVVLDERMAFIDRTLKNMLSISIRAVKENGRLIHVTHIPELKDKDHASYSSELVTIPVNSSRSPIPEPLIVISRLLNESIPEMVIDTVSWSVKENHRMLIFTPSVEMQRIVHARLLDLMEFGVGEIGLSTTQDKTAVMRLKKRELQIVISCDFRDTLSVVDDLNVIVMHADREEYSKETLLNMCAMAVYHTRKKCGQVIFVVEKDCESVTKTKESIRGINKIAWESGFIKK